MTSSPPDPTSSPSRLEAFFAQPTDPDDQHPLLTPQPLTPQLSELDLTARVRGLEVVVEHFLERLEALEASALPPDPEPTSTAPDAPADPTPDSATQLVQAWLREATAPAQPGTSSTVLHEAFTAHCLRNGTPPDRVPTITKWGRTLTRLGYSATHAHTGKLRPLQVAAAPPGSASTNTDGAPPPKPAQTLDEVVARWVTTETESCRLTTAPAIDSLYNAFTRHCRRAHVADIPSRTSWGFALTRLGYPPHKTNDGKRRALRVRRTPDQDRRPEARPAYLDQIPSPTSETP